MQSESTSPWRANGSLPPLRDDNVTQGTHYLTTNTIMKRTAALFLLLALAGMSFAQTTRFVYIPGPGEHRIGATFGMGFGKQDIKVGLGDNFNNSVRLSNTSDFSAGVCWGYETDDNRIFDFGNYVAFLFKSSPFSGNVNIDNTSYKMNVNAGSIHLYESPFAVIHIVDGLVLNLGIGFEFSYGLNPTMHVDGTKMKMQKLSEESVLTRFNVSLDANVGVKYYFADDYYVGARLQYVFLNDFFNLFGDDDSDGIIGAAAADLTDNTGIGYFRPIDKPFMLSFQIGYCW